MRGRCRQIITGDEPVTAGIILCTSGPVTAGVILRVGPVIAGIIFTPDQNKFGV